MGLFIPDELLQSARMSEEEMKREIALLLYQNEKLTLAQACRFCGMSRLQFQHLLSSRQIPIHYSNEDLQEDLQTLEALKKK